MAGWDRPARFRGLLRGLAALGSWWVLNIVSYALVLALLALRRFRHLIMWLIVANLREKGRDLHAEFIGLLPAPPQPVSIQRWTLRRVGLMAGTLVLLVLAVGPCCP